MTSVVRVSGLVVAGAMFVACSDQAAPKSDAGASPLGDSGADAAAFDTGSELRIPVPDSGRIYVALGAPRIVSVADPKASLDWDLAFEGLDVFTNGGPSGGGKGASFGPLDAVAFVGDEAPAVPFLFADKTGGAFEDWYDYEGAPTHALWSRYHVLGVRDGARTWKVQVLGYYGLRDGASIAGLYTIRYAEVTGGTTGEVRDGVVIDGSAGGAKAPPSTPSECLDLASGTRMALTPDAARASNAWHLCFRRQTISVNGELGGPRAVGAVDLDASATAAETIEAVKARTAQTERARFDAVTSASFDGKTFRGDRVVSGFGDAWIAAGSSPKKPSYASWLVVAASGDRRFLVGFSAFESPTAKSPGTVVMRIKPVKG